MKRFGFLLFCLVCLLSALPTSAAAASEDLTGGQCRFSVTFDRPQAWVEIFIRRNGEQIFAGGIMASEIQNADGTYTYQHIQNGLVSGDYIENRFYSYAAGSPGVFTPGPGENSWSAHSYSGAAGSGSSATTYRSLGSGNARFEVTTAGAQAYVEIFVRRNGNQIFAGPIMGSGVANPDGSYLYGATLGGFVEGDRLEYRFYHYTSSGAAKFTPGPGSDVWANAAYANDVSAGVVFVRASVAPTGTEDGSLSHPFPTIRQALDKALTAGSGVTEIRVAEGTYPEISLRLVDGVNLLGGYTADFAARDAAAHVSLIDGGDRGNIFFADHISSPTTLDGFTVQNGSIAGFYSHGFGGGGMLIYYGDGNFVVSHNVFRNNKAIYGAIGGNIFMYFSSATLTANRIVDGFTGGGLGGSDLKISSRDENGAGPKVYGNVFSSNGSTSGMIYAEPSFNTNTNIDGTPHVPSTPW